MEPSDKVRQVWVFLSEGEQWHSRPLYLAALDLLRREGVAGATALRGIAGYGTHGQIHTTQLVELASELPVVLVFVDRAERVERVLPQLIAMAPGALISVTDSTLAASGHRSPGPFPAHLTAADVMSRDVAVARPDTPLDAIVTLLIDRALRALPVVDADERVVGIITDGDLLSRGGLALSTEAQRLLPLPERAAAVAALAEHPHSAADLMTPQPLTLPAETPLAQAAAIMAGHNLKRLPVVDARGRLVGMLSRYDLLKTVAEGLRQRPAEPPRPPSPASATAEAIMLRDAPSVHRETPLAETLDRLLETEKRRVVVVDDDGRVVGIITDGDVLRRAARRVRPGALRALAAWLGGGGRPDELELSAQGRSAADIMTSPVVTVRTDTPIVEAIRLMIQHKIKRLPVVDPEGRPVGLIGRAGVLAALSHKDDAHE